MPIFGLVWVASWVGCFFSSNQALLHAPTYSLSTLSTQTLSNISQSIQNRSSFNRSRLVAFRAEAGSYPQIQNTLGPVAALPVSDPGPSAVTSPLGNLFATFKTLFVGQATAPSDESVLDKNSALPLPLFHRPSVVVAKIDAKPSLDRRKADSQFAGLGFSQCATPSDEDAQVDDRSNIFQIRVKDYVVGETTNQQQAELFARRLKQLLQNSKLKPTQIKPAVVNGAPAAKFDDRLLFTVDKEIAKDWDCNPELLAINWINNLRVALKEQPLSLTDAQETMHRLQDTEERIAGLASWYGPYFHGRITATGETFDQNEFTAAHPSLPFDTYLKVTNLNNGKSVVVRVNDRGPYFENRTLDLSREAARSLESETVGVVPFEAVIMRPTQTKETSQEVVAGL